MESEATDSFTARPPGDSRSARQMRRAFESATPFPKEVHRLGAPHNGAGGRDDARGCGRGWRGAGEEGLRH